MASNLKKSLTDQPKIALAVAIVFALQSGLGGALDPSVAIVLYAQALAGAAKQRFKRGYHVRSSRPVYNENEQRAVVTLTVEALPSPEGELIQKRIEESFLQFSDDLVFAKTCVEVGHAASLKIQDGTLERTRVVPSTQPLAEIARLEENGDVLVSKRPTRHVKLCKAVIAAAGDLTKNGVSVKFEWGNSSSIQMPSVSKDATKIHRHVVDTVPVLADVSGYFKKKRTAEVTIDKRTMELLIPGDFANVVEEALAKQLNLLMTVRKFVPSNPVLPDEPKFEIVSIEKAVGSREFEELKKISEKF